MHLSVLAAITHAPAADRLCRDISRRGCYLCLRCSYAAFAFATAALQHLPVARPLRTWSRGSFLKPRWRHSPKLLGRGHDCLIHQSLKVLLDGSFLAPAVSTSHPLATAIIIATTVPRRNRPTCHRSCRCGLAFIGAVATAFILATSPPPPHVDHRRAADVQADVQAVVALAAPASRWFGRSRSPASWGCLASSALLEWALCSKYCQITHTCAQINILRVPHTHTPCANVRVVNRANRAPPGGGPARGYRVDVVTGGVLHTRHGTPSTRCGHSHAGGGARGVMFVSYLLAK